MALNAVDEIIRDARARGEFDNLKGKGKPLDHCEYFRRPESIRLAYTLLGNSGFIPPEVELQRDVGELKERLAGTKDEAARKQLMRDIERNKIKIELLLRQNR